MRANKHIRRVYVKMLLDENPDLSHLGNYGNTPGPGAIDREERGDMGRDEFRYFTPAMTGEQTGNPESPEQDYRRMEAFTRGDWSMHGIRACAEIVAAGTTQTICSAGLWGIESDSDPSYFTDVAGEQLEELYAILRDFGFTDESIWSVRVEYPKEIPPVEERGLFDE